MDRVQLSQGYRATTRKSELVLNPHSPWYSYIILFVDDIIYQLTEHSFTFLNPYVSAKENTNWSYQRVMKYSWYY